MKNEATSTTESPKPASPRGRKKWLLIVPLVLVAVIVLIIAMVPVWVSSSSGRTFIVNKVNKSTSGELRIGGLSMGWFSGIDASDLSFSDVAAGMKVNVKQFSTAPHYLSFLMGGAELGKTVIEKPEIEIRVDETKPEVSPAAGEKKEAASGPVGLPIKMLDLTITEGSVKITSSAPGYQAVQISNIAAKVDIRPGDAKSDFTLAMNVESGGGKSDVKASGSATGITKKGWRLTDTTGDLNIQVNDLDLGSLQGLLAAGGVKMQAAGRLNSNIVASIDNGEVKGLDINVSGENIAIGGEALKGDTLKTSRLKAMAKVSTEVDTLKIQEAVVTTDWLEVTAAGSLPTKAFSARDLMSPASAYTLKANISCNAAQALSQMPNMLGMKPGMQMTSGSLKAEVGSSVSGGQRVISCNATIADLKGTMDGKPVALSAPVRLEAEIVSDGTKTLLEKGIFAASFGEIDCKGPFDSLSYTARLDLAKLTAEAGQFVDMAGYSVGGNFDGNGTVSMKDGAIAAAGKSKMTDLRISAKGQQAKMQLLALDHDIRYDSAGGNMTLDAVTLDGDFGKIAVRDGQVAMGDKGGMRLGAAAQIDLKKLLPFAVAFGGLPGQTDMAGRLVADVVAVQEGSAWKVAIKDTSITDFMMIYPGQQPLSQKKIAVAFEGVIDPAKQTVSARQLSIVSEAINVSGTFEKASSASTSSLKGQVKAEYDLAAVSTLAAPYLPKGMTMKGIRKQDLAFSSTWPTAEPKQMLANMSGKTVVGFDEMKYMGMTFGKANVNVGIDKGLLNIEPFSVPMNNGTLNFGATADFTKTPTFLVLSKPMTVLNAIHVTDEMVGYDKVKKWLEMIPLMSDASNVSGIAGFKCSELRVPLAGAGENAVVAVGTIDVNDLRTNSNLLGQLSSAIGRDASAITIMPTDFTLRDGVARYESMKMLVAGEVVDFRGWIGLNDTMDMSVVTPVKISGSRLTLRIDGPPSKPKLNLGKTIQENLPGLILQEVLKNK